MNLGIFVGTYMDQKLDSKGRLSVPAKWRERLGTEFFMVCMNLRGSTCIKLYPQDEFMHCVEALDDGTANEVYEKNKIFFSNADHFRSGCRRKNRSSVTEIRTSCDDHLRKRTYPKQWSV